MDSLGAVTRVNAAASEGIRVSELGKFIAKTQGEQYQKILEEGKHEERMKAFRSMAFIRFFGSSQDLEALVERGVPVFKKLLENGEAYLFTTNF